MGRGIVQNDKPNGLRFTLKQQFQMGAHFLMPFALVNGRPSLSRGIFQTAQEGIPGIREARRIHAHLGALGGRTGAHIRAPMESRGIKKPQLSGFRRLTPIRLRDVMTAQGAGNRFFLKGSA